MGRVASGLVLLLCWADLSSAGPHTLAGRRLEDVLRILQQDGLPIVFSSEVVRPDMRVLVEPRAPTPRQQLDEVLAPHGLKAQPAPGHRLVIVADRTLAIHRPSSASSPDKNSADGAPPPGPRAVAEYADRITVWGVGDQSIDSGASDATLGTGGIRAATSVLAGDGLDAVRAMPRAVGADDFQSVPSIRGNGSRQIGIVIDGVATPWLQHAVYGWSDAGSLAMLTSDAVDRVSVDAGAYPRQYNDVLGGQVDVTLKEGSRQATQLAVRAGGTSAAVAGDGPIGGDGRGSWIVGARTSYRSWPPIPVSSRDVGFAFADAHAKLVYDMSATQQVTVTVVAGQSTPETVDEPSVGPLASGIDRAALVSVGWRSILGSRTVVRQRAFFVGQELESSLTGGERIGRSTNRAAGYRVELLHSVMGGLLTEAAEMSAVDAIREVNVANELQLPGAFRATWATPAAYVDFSRALPAGVRFEGGARFSGSQLVHHRALAPWTRVSWRFTPAWTMSASMGASRQFADIEAVRGPLGTPNLSPERASLLDLSVEERLTHVRWEATIFNRRETDMIRSPEAGPNSIESATFDAAAGHYRNGSSGSARGMELVVIPDAAARLSGWLSYTFAMARQSNTGTGETFWSDFDRRHAINLVATLGLGRHSSVSAVVRGASGIPIPGYFTMVDGTLRVGDRRNTVRLPAYARLDARVQRTFFSSRHTVTLFGEVLNVLNRSNQGLATGSIQPLTGEAIGFSRGLLPRRASVGIDVSVGR